MSTISASTTTTTAYKVTADTTGTLVLQTGSTPTTAVTIDTAQNVGLGVTPSAWSGLGNVLELSFAGNGIAGGAANSVYYSQNTYFNGTNWIYGSTNAATYYRQGQGLHRWYNAPSGTAGTTATFTQAMTLDASGNLGVGTTAPYGKFQVRSATDVNLFIRDAATVGLSSGNILENFNNAAGSAVPFYVRASQSIFGTDSGGTFVERARIDSSGNLLVGTTSSGSRRLYVAGSNAGYITSTENTNASPFGLQIYYSAAAPNGTSNQFIECVDSSATRFRVLSNGNAQNTNNSYGAISDVKLKENITDATPKLTQLNQVRVVNYNFIGDEYKQLGVIAQELEQIFPAMVEEIPDHDSDGNDLGTTTKSVKYSVFVPMLIKAIQEQQAIIEQLTNRITALEAK